MRRDGLSPRAPPWCQAEYSGLIDFVEVGQLGAAFARLAAVPATERDALAARRFADFANRFSPGAIFRRAGISDMLEARAQARAIRIHRI